MISLFTAGWRVGSQSFMTALLILIASGWSLTFKTLFEKEGLIMTLGGVIISNVAIGFVSKLDDGEYHKFHDFSGITGILMILI